MLLFQGRSVLRFLQRFSVVASEAYMTFHRVSLSFVEGSVFTNWNYDVQVKEHQVSSYYVSTLSHSVRQGDRFGANVQVYFKGLIHVVRYIRIPRRTSFSFT